MLANAELSWLTIEQLKLSLACSILTIEICLAVLNSFSFIYPIKIIKTKTLGPIEVV